MQARASSVVASGVERSLLCSIVSSCSSSACCWTGHTNGNVSWFVPAGCSCVLLPQSIWHQTHARHHRLRVLDHDVPALLTPRNGDDSFLRLYQAAHFLWEYPISQSNRQNLRKSRETSNPFLFCFHVSHTSVSSLVVFSAFLLISTSCWVLHASQLSTSCSDLFSCWFSRPQGWFSDSLSSLLIITGSLWFSLFVSWSLILSL